MAVGRYKQATEISNKRDYVPFDDTQQINSVH